MIVLVTGGPPAIQQAPAATQADPLVFNSDRMLVVIRVAEATAVDFEVTMGKVKEVLAKSDKPERRRQAAGWKLLKSPEPQDGLISFFFVLDKVEKGVSYDPFKILGEGLPPDEVGALFQKVVPGLKGISATPLAPIVSMGGGGSTN
ncbi:MAG TPA: hypothetical protein VN700_13985 [Vicinamibacterales bacterium]|nr:hypothetical protein [Vicinamibacterales bacterium]